MPSKEISLYNQTPDQPQSGHYVNLTILTSRNMIFDISLTMFFKNQYFSEKKQTFYIFVDSFLDNLRIHSLEK